MKFAFLLATLAAVFSLVPIFGSIISSIPIFVVALSTGGITSALLAILWIAAPLTGLLVQPIIGHLVSSLTLAPSFASFTAVSGAAAEITRKAICAADSEFGRSWFFSISAMVAPYRGLARVCHSHPLSWFII